MSSPIRHILLPTDLSPIAAPAFAMAVKMTLQNKGRLTCVHVSPSGDPNWSAMPTVRQLLTTWKVLPEWATVDEYTDLGMRVQFHARPGTDVVREILEEADDAGPFDLIVMPAHHRDVVAQWLQPSVSEPVARRSGLPCLLVPERAQRGLVGNDGRAHVNRVLFPIGDEPRDALVLDPTMRVVAALGSPRCRGTVLHVGPKSSIPEIDVASKGAWAWDTEVRSGSNVSTEVLQVADEMGADLIAMASHGHDSALDSLVGSHTERVLHRSLCPLLVVPVH